MFRDTDLLLRDIRRSLDRTRTAWRRGLSSEYAEREEHEALHELASAVEDLDRVLSSGGTLPDDWAPRLRLGAEPLGGPMPGVGSELPEGPFHRLTDYHDLDMDGVG